jgi:hypothetical protein
VIAASSRFAEGVGPARGRWCRPITEFILKHDGKPSYTVSIMEFRSEKVARETQYFADPFAAPTSRAPRKATALLKHWLLGFEVLALGMRSQERERS